MKLRNVSNIPKGTYVATSSRIADLMNDIVAKEKDCLSGTEIIDLCRKINENKVDPTTEIREEHVEKIRDETGENRIYR